MIEEHRLHREQLMERLWPELDPEAQANNLRHQALHAARRALESALPSQGPRNQRSVIGRLPSASGRWRPLSLGIRPIAEEFVLSKHTVATHVRKILKKLGLRSRLQIAAWAMEQDLLLP